MPGEKADTNIKSKTSAKDTTNDKFAGRRGKRKAVETK